MTQSRPGRDRRAVRHAAPVGAPHLTDDRHVLVVGGGIAGLAAATGLAERGARVTLFESTARLGGRVAAWPLDEGRTMSRGFHAFFRQYYNLRALLKRIDPNLEFLVPIEDYPLQRPDGTRESFAGLARTPPASFIQFVLRSPAFTSRTLAQVNVSAALELLQVRFPQTYSDYDGESAASFLDRLRFPQGARDLALEVFARSFFADPSEFGAGELVAMFHTYFLGSAEGLLFDVPDDDYDTALWAPLGSHLHCLGVEVHTDAVVEAVDISEDAASLVVDGNHVTGDAVVLAADPRSTRRLASTISGNALSGWQDAVAETYNAPPFTVVRLWLATPVAPERPAFLGTSGYGPLDNISVLERFEDGATQWARERGGSVVELHAYACHPEVATDASAAHGVVERLEAEMHRIFPETASAEVLHREVLIEDDCTLIGPHGWDRRPGVATPSPRLMLAGDWVRTGYPVALMERAATTGFLASNMLLENWGVGGHPLWTAPMNGLLRRSIRR